MTPDADTLASPERTSHEGAASGSPRTAALDIRFTLPLAELTRLCRAVEAPAQSTLCQVIQFASAYAAEGSGSIAFETALASATLLGKRVLYIDSQTAHQHPMAKELSTHITDSLDMPLGVGQSLKDAMVMVEQTRFVYGTLRSLNTHETRLPDINLFHSVLEVLRQSFDLIVIDSPGVLNNVFSAALAKLCDGCILVVEAERTRAPVTLQAVRMIETSGGRMLGAVLNKRRFYIPQWLYRILYRKHATQH